MNRPELTTTGILAALLLSGGLGLLGSDALAQNNLNLTSSERQQPVDIQADNTDGSLDGDGISTLCGNVRLSQGSLVVEADCAEITYLKNRIASVRLTGEPVTWNQTVPDTGPVSASARIIDYSVADGRVEMRGDAELHHPTGDLYGEVLIYDQQTQRFRGEGAGNGDQIRVRLESAVFDDEDSAPGNPASTPATESESQAEPQTQRTATGH